MALLAVTVSLGFVGIGVRLVQLQVVSPDRFVAFGDQLRVRSDDLPATRGAVYDRNRHDLVLPVERHVVAADPALIAEAGIDPAGLAQRLATALNVDEATLTERLSEDSRFVLLARGVDDDIADELAAEQLPGIVVTSEPTRFRPGGPLGSPMLGSVSQDNAGLGGVELRWNHLLEGTPGTRRRERDGGDRTIESGKFEQVDPVDGTDLYLSIDRDLQFQSERIVGDAVSRLGANWGVAIISDPDTGAILAMVSMDRDPETGTARVSSHNRAVADSFEAGSVLKMVPYAAALEDGKLRLQETLSVPEQLTNGGVTISNDIAQQSGERLPAETVAYSSNTAAVMVAQRLGDQRLHDWLTTFGFGRRTPLRLPGESRGTLRSADVWTESSTPSLAIGHELAVTPAQLLAAYNVVWNDGMYLPPRLVDATRQDGDDEPTPVAQAQGRRVVSVRTAAQMRGLLTGVVDDGTATQAALEGYSVAGKTGTARKILTAGPEAGTYGSPGNRVYTSSFSGALPAGDPELSIVVVFDGAQAEFSGGKTAAPVFRELAQFATTHLQIRPDRGTAATVFSDSAEPAVDYSGTPQSQIELQERQAREEEQAREEREAQTDRRAVAPPASAAPVPVEAVPVQDTGPGTTVAPRAQRR